MNRIVIKLGTGILSKQGGSCLNRARFQSIATDIAALVERGMQCVLVSSGAIAAGVEVMGLKSRPQDLAGKQACAAAGQPILMRMYDACLRRHGLHAAQLLLTHGDIDSRLRCVNARNTLERLLTVGAIVPVINENDSVAVDELRFSDNDRLSAEVARLAHASLLVILTSSDGLLADGVRIPEVADVSAAFAHVREDTGAFSVGGMRAKLEAVRDALEAGIPAVIADGAKPGALLRAATGEDEGTRFRLPETLAGNARPEPAPA